MPGDSVLRILIVAFAASVLFAIAYESLQMSDDLENGAQGFYKGLEKRNRNLYKGLEKRNRNLYKGWVKYHNGGISY